jgi:hypothetical protein
LAGLLDTDRKADISVSDQQDELKIPFGDLLVSTEYTVQYTGHTRQISVLLYTCKVYLIISPVSY